MTGKRQRQIRRWLFIESVVVAFLAGYVAAWVGLDEPRTFRVAVYFAVANIIFAVLAAIIDWGIEDDDSE